MSRKSRPGSDSGSGGGLISGFLAKWQTDFGLMKCQECKRKNKARGSEKLEFVTFQCDHFHYVCTNCATNAACNYTSGDQVCYAPQMPVKQTASRERFPSRPWLHAEASMLNDHRDEVLGWQNIPPHEFDTAAAYEDYAAERTAIAHDLHDDDEKKVALSVEKYLSLIHI